MGVGDENGGGETGGETESLTGQQPGIIGQTHLQSHQSPRLVLKQVSPALQQALNF